MSRPDKPSVHPVTECLAPDWFVQAKDAGASTDELRTHVHAYCKEVLYRRALNQGLPTPEGEPDEAWVEMMFAMYEAACADRGGEV